MNLLRPSSRSPKQLERLEKIRAKGRKHYIFYTGMLGWGLSVFALTTIWDWHDKYGWQIPAGEVLHRHLALVPLKLAVWLTAGYFFGSIMWKRIMDQPHAKS